MQKIEIRCSGSEMLPLKSMRPLQGNLKELTKDGFGRLKESLLENGFCFPFFAWRYNDMIYYLDGTQRDRVLNELSKDKTVQLPEEYPVVFIHAKNKQEAAKMILLQSSRYGRMTNESLYEFLHENTLKIEDLKIELDLPDIDVEVFMKGYNDETFVPAEDDQANLDTKKSVKCPECGNEFTP